MSSQIFSVSFTVAQYNVGGAQTITAMVEPGWIIGGNLQYFPNVSGGNATVTFQYWKDKKTVQGPVSLEITAQLPNSNTITVPSGVDTFVMTFGTVTFPAGNVNITLTKGA